MASLKLVPEELDPGHDVVGVVPVRRLRVHGVDAGHSARAAVVRSYCALQPDAVTKCIPGLTFEARSNQDVLGQWSPTCP